MLVYRTLEIRLYFSTLSEDKHGISTLKESLSTSTYIAHLVFFEIAAFNTNGS
jgi:hypothetical protein